MNPEETSRRLLSAFGRSVGLPEIEFNEDGLCILDMDEKLVLTIRENLPAEHWTLLGLLGEFPEDMPEGFYRSLLAFNYDLADRGGPTIGLDPQTDMVMLCRTFPLRDADLEVFSETLSRFVDTLEHLLDALNAASSEDQGDTAPEQASGPVAAQPDPSRFV